MESGTIRRALVGSALLAFALALPASAGAATIAVDTTADISANDGLCSLREAVQATNDDADVNGADDCDHDGGSGLDTIILGSDTYVVSGADGDDSNLNGDLDLRLGTGGLTIDGAGQGSTILDSDGSDRVIDYVTGTGPGRISELTIKDGSPPTGGGGGVRFSNPPVTLSAVTLTKNGGGLFGGGVRMDGTTSTLNIIDGSVITDNTTADSGAGIHTGGGTLNITDSTVSLNHTDYEFATGTGISSGSATTITRSLIEDNNATGTSSNGGGVALTGAAPSLTMVDSVVRLNDAADAGGILFNSDEDLNITGSSVSDNDSVNSAGGIHYIGAGTATIDSSSVSGNQAGGSGGGIAQSAFGAGIALTNSTLSGNISGLSGGALNAGDGPATLRNVTLAGNAATTGPSIFSISTSDEVNLKAVILADGATPCDGGTAAFDSGGYNVNQGTGTGGSCDLVDTGDANSTDPQLGPLALNGGPTETRAIAPSSPARNRVPLGECLSADQRGFPRPFPPGGSCDSGAYELNGVCLGAGLTILPGGATGTTINGTPGADVIDAGAGNDTILGLGGADRICGGAGADTASFAGGGAVTASTTAASGQGADRLASIENLTGTSFADVLIGSSLANLLHAGAGNDTIRGKGGRDALFGDAGIDKLLGGRGRDRLNGGAGRPDTCNGGPGRDRRKAKGCERKRKIP